MSLGDYTGGGNWFKPGRYTTRIQSCRWFDYNSGSRGIEFTFGDGTRKITDACVVWDAQGNPSKALWKLVQIAQDVGYTDQQLKQIDERDFNSIDRLCQNLINRSIGIEVDKQDGGKYSEVVGYYSIEQPKNLPPRPSDNPRSAAPAPRPAVTNDFDPNVDDGVPF